MFLGSFRNNKLVKQKEETYPSLESTGSNEKLGVINPQGYSFNTVLPKQGISKYSGSRYSNADLKSEIFELENKKEIQQKKNSEVCIEEFHKIKEENTELRLEIEKLKEEKEELKQQRDLNYQLFMKAQKKLSQTQH